MLNNNNTALTRKIDEVDTRANQRLSTLETNLQGNTINVDRLCNDMHTFMTRFQQMTPLLCPSPHIPAQTTTTTPIPSPDTKCSKHSAATTMDSTLHGSPHRDVNTSFMSADDSVTGLPALERIHDEQYPLFEDPTAPRHTTPTQDVTRQQSQQPSAQPTPAPDRTMAIGNNKSAPARPPSRTTTRNGPRK